ncbi:Threonine synthase-like [Actinidia chinensis var. chinensis]|uniref:Threonine synthase-like n=1 Tax=Actinidia chinensis var. chinensis TaxID=1590841 RepID=A0A2R6QCC6_ACTCC|nr:Threonine synthase-like [Actinidia chinensis var. chinensis]
MKFLAEFGLCFGGATVIQPQQEVALPTKSRAASRSSRKVNSAHWKPALSIISEDGVVSEIGNKHVDRKARSLKKARPTDTTCSHSHNDDYRNDPMLMALPDFSPTPYLF